MKTPVSPVPRRRWLTFAQTAEELGVSERTLRTYVADGRLPASRIKGSRLLRFRPEDIEALIVPVPTTGGGV